MNHTLRSFLVAAALPALAAAIASAQADGFNPVEMASDSLPLTLSTASVTTGPLPSPARP